MVKGEKPYRIYEYKGCEMSVRDTMTLETDGQHIAVVRLKAERPRHLNIPVKRYKRGHINICNRILSFFFSNRNLSQTHIYDNLRLKVTVLNLFNNNRNVAVIECKTWIVTKYTRIPDTQIWCHFVGLVVQVEL